jgi:hypothetical protein
MNGLEEPLKNPVFTRSDQQMPGNAAVGVTDLHWIRIQITTIESKDSSHLIAELSLVLYGRGTWSLTQREENNLSVPRTEFGRKREEVLSVGGWR